MADPDLLKKLTGKIENSRIGKNRKLTVFLVFVGIAIFFWFLRALEKEYTTHIDHPVFYQNMPDDQVLVNELPEKMSLEVTGTGFAILKHNWDIAKNPIRINVKQYLKTGVKRGNRIRISLATNLIKNKVDNQLPNLTVIDVLPDSVFFEFSPQFEKKVPVVADLELELEKQFMIRDQVLIDPDSITLKGPGVILDSIHEVSTDLLKFRKVRSTLKRNVALIRPHDQVRMSDKRVVVEIPIEQFTEKTVSVQVNPINLPDSLTMKLFPAQVQVTFKVVVSAFEEIEAGNFVIEADYQQVSHGTTQKISPQLSKTPALIENPRMSPEFLDFLLEKK